jgi:Flp pilus assembly protein TadB
MIAPALLLGVAVVLLLARPSASARLTRVAPVRREPTAPSSWVRPAAFAVGGAGIGWLVGGVAGLLLGVAVLVVGPRLLGRLDDTEDDAAALAEELPLALDLLAACLAGGASLMVAVEAVRDAMPGPCGHRLGRVAAALAVGSGQDEAFRALGDDSGPAGSAARALARAAEGGTPVAAAVARVAAEARRTASAAAERRAKRAGVLAVGPLGACFLPAFVLLGVVPAVVGLGSPLLSTL